MRSAKISANTGRDKRSAAPIATASATKKRAIFLARLIQPNLELGLCDDPAVANVARRSISLRSNLDSENSLQPRERALHDPPRIRRYAGGHRATWRRAQGLAGRRNALALGAGPGSMERDGALAFPGGRLDEGPSGACRRKDLSARSARIRPPFPVSCPRAGRGLRAARLDERCGDARALPFRFSPDRRLSPQRGRDFRCPHR